MTNLTTDYKGRMTVKGMSRKDTVRLMNMFNIPERKKTWETVAEYIERTGCKTERTTSAKGTELITVFYHTGVTKTYEYCHIDNTTAFY